MKGWTWMALVLGMGLLSSGALEWQGGRGFRRAQLPTSTEGKIGFTSMEGSVTGIGFSNFVAIERHLTNQILLNGSGIAAGDVDGDGWCDVFFCGLSGGSQLYRNLGDWKFGDITEAAGVNCAGLDVTGAALVDFEGDGDLDLVINSVGAGTHIFINGGKGQFRRVTPPGGLNPGACGTSMAFGDIDGDGYLDFYVTNYRTQALMDMPETEFRLVKVGGKQVVASMNGRSASAPELAGRFRVNDRGGIEENGEPDVFYRNLGGTNVFSLGAGVGTFLDETGEVLSEPLRDWGLSVMLRDMNGDGLPDLYVCNDFDSADRVWINQGGGRFRAIERLALRKTSLFSMGLDFGDIDRDGLDDFMVLDMLSREHAVRMDTHDDGDPPVPGIGVMGDRPEYMMNTVFLNRGDGTYAEIGQLSGLEASGWSWAVLFLDVDLDGWEDVLISNGHERTARSIDMGRQMKAMRLGKKLSPMEILMARRIYPRHDTLNLAFRNLRNLTFEEVGQEWGFTTPTVSHGMALADLDNDGDQDLVVNNLNDPAGVYRNEASGPRVAVWLRGRPPNTRGIGARITLQGGGVVTQSQEMMCGGRYLSSDEPVRVFAAGAGTNDMTIEVKWRSGKVSVVEGVKGNWAYEIDEPEGEPEAKRPEARSESIFEDVSELIQHQHVESSFDDFEGQPLLPKRLSQLGPGVGWFDLEGDGWEDLVIGSGRGGSLAFLHNNAQGGFERVGEERSGSASVARDQTGIVGWSGANGEREILVGLSNYEEGSEGGSSLVRYGLKARGLKAEELAVELGSIGPLALGDLDGDGDLDLFVGGRVMAGRYPEAVSSMVLRNQNGRLDPDQVNEGVLSGIGLVSGAVWSDLDGDGDEDLVVACEWGAVRVFRNAAGKLSEATEELGLARYRGWWNGVVTGDFDGDGNLDIVASNWGRNGPQESHRGHPIELFFGDFDGNDSMDIVEGYYDSGLRRVVPERMLDDLARGMPILGTRFSSYQDYGSAGVRQVLGDASRGAKRLTVNWLESTLFLNRGTGFVARALPVEAQMAPAFGVCAGDLDGDGFEDVFLSQNFFALPPGIPRYDAGRGLWLRGDGRGDFTAVSGQESGIRVYGEQRGCALGDFNRDGRVDLVVTQNGASTKLFRNRGARPGLRIRVRGPAGNPDGAGVRMRLGSVDGWGPMREIHSGSGYWSQDGAVQVMSYAGEATRIELFWPGGKSRVSEIPPGLQEMEVGEP